MQCTGYIHSRNNLPVGANGFSWNLFNGEESGYNMSVPQYTMDQYLGYEKDVMRRIIQNHEATFRYQVQELHRLYKRQKELMDETKVGEIFNQHLQTQAWPNISQTSHTPSWLFRDRSDNIQECITLHPANGSEHGFVKTEDLSSFNSSSSKTNIWIDLNEPANSMEIMHSDSPVLEEAKKLEVVSDGTNSSVVIDLNCMPLSETEISLENLQNMTKDEDREEKSDCDSGVDDKFLKVKSFIDLNSDIVLDEPFPSLTNTNMELEGPVSPENKEGSPPRKKTEDIPLDDKIAAKTLIMMFDSEVEELSKAAKEPLVNSRNPLHWFAEIVSSTEESDVNLSPVVGKEKNTGRARRGRACANVRKNRKNSKLSHLDIAKKSTSSILKKPVTRSKQGVLQDWGNVKKRRGGMRRKASKFLVMS